MATLFDLSKLNPTICLNLQNKAITKTKLTTNKPQPMRRITSKVVSSLQSFSPPAFGVSSDFILSTNIWGVTSPQAGMLEEGFGSLSADSMKITCIPMTKCQVIWQWNGQTPGFSATKRTTTQPQPPEGGKYTCWIDWPFHTWDGWSVFKIRRIKSSLRGRRLKGNGKGVLGKGILGARETRGAHEEGGRFSLSLPFHTPATQAR